MAESSTPRLMNIHASHHFSSNSHWRKENNRHFSITSAAREASRFPWLRRFPRFRAIHSCYIF